MVILNLPSSIESMYIDGVKSQYTNYQTEYEGSTLYQKAYVFPCSNEEVALIILATEEKRWPDSFNHFINSIHFKEDLPSNIQDY